ncbi:unnamed protein product [Rhizophagus irregularis]|uniref:Uncharacterized protein n=1 Tax=Rhizophagus irregularis TaxID=588596 RepID=A0A916E1P6_9GLOM|nr:unnamed protein product [Rhizophagus irregularis]
MFYDATLSCGLRPYDIHSNPSGTSNKKIKPIEDENNDYATKELELDIDMNPKQFSDDEYITSEINFDI